MEVIIFVGIPASGKSTFFKERFFNTHVRINLDMLKTRNREKILVEACIESKAKFVVDNTNPTKNDRATIIRKTKQKGYKVVGYYFASSVDEALKRNELRSQRVPDVAIYSCYKKLELPAYSEEFDELYYVKIDGTEYRVEVWNDEV